MVLPIQINDKELEDRLYLLYQRQKMKDRSKTWTDLIRTLVDESRGGEE